MRERFSRFMYGRYGVDHFGRFLLYFALIVMLINLFVEKLALFVIATALLVFGYFRIFSRNIYKRSYENDRYLALKNKFLGLFRKSGGNNTYSSRCNSYYGSNAAAEYRIFKCPRCKQKLRVPRGKGRISISCKKCNYEFIKHT